MLNSVSWKQVLTNTIAFWLISNGCGTLSFLSELNLAELARQHANSGGELPNDGTAIAVGKMFIGTAIVIIIWLLFAFFISVIVSARRKWYWVNSVLALILVVLANHYLPSGNYFLLTMPGSQFTGAWYYILYGIVMVVIGIILLWPKKPTSQHTDNNKTSPSPNYA